jgi:hypothetical protein
VRLPIELRVSDNGPGVDPAMREHMFEPFVTTKKSGQGLGLALVRKLVRDMNGRISHERDEAGGWTHFRIHLPLAASGAIEPQRGETMSVLLVEDDASIAHGHHRCAGGRGLYRDPLRQHRRARPAAGTAPLFGAGYRRHAARRRRHRDPGRGARRIADMPIIILSAQNTLDTAVRASDTGAFEYFPKPFDIDELARTVRQAVGVRKSRAREGEEVPVAGLPLVGRRHRCRRSTG